MPERAILEHEIAPWGPISHPHPLCSGLFTTLFLFLVLAVPLFISQHTTVFPGQILSAQVLTRIPLFILPHLRKDHFDKVKNHSVASVMIDKDLWLQA